MTWCFSTLLQNTNTETGEMAHYTHYNTIWQKAAHLPVSFTNLFWSELSAKIGIATLEGFLLFFLIYFLLKWTPHSDQQSGAVASLHAFQIPLIFHSFGAESTSTFSPSHSESLCIRGRWHQLKCSDMTLICFHATIRGVLTFLMKLMPVLMLWAGEFFSKR